MKNNEPDTKSDHASDDDNEEYFRKSENNESNESENNEPNGSEKPKKI